VPSRQTEPNADHFQRTGRVSNFPSFRCVRGGVALKIQVFLRSKRRSASGSDPQAVVRQAVAQGLPGECGRVSTRPPALKDTWPTNDEGMVELNGLASLIRAATLHLDGFAAQVHRLNRHHPLHHRLAAQAWDPLQWTAQQLQGVHGAAVQSARLRLAAASIQTFEVRPRMSCRIGPLRGSMDWQPPVNFWPCPTANGCGFPLKHSKPGLS